MFSPLALGTDCFTYVDEDHVARLYCAYREAGGNTFDTAHSYAYWNGKIGLSERRLGAMVRRFESRREDVVVITKGGHIPIPKYYDVPDDYLDPSLLARQFEESMERLGLDHVDWYLLHRDDPRVPAERHVEAVQPFVRGGRARAVGVSNWRPPRIDEALNAARTKGWRPFEVCEAFHNLGEPRPGTRDPLYPFVDGDDLAWYERTRFPMLAFTSTMWGQFSSTGPLPEFCDTPTTAARRERVQSLANRLGVTGTQLALAALRASPFPCTPIFSTIKVEEVRENMASARIHLTPEQRHWLRTGESGGAA